MRQDNVVSYTVWLCMLAVLVFFIFFISPLTLVKPLPVTEQTQLPYRPYTPDFDDTETSLFPLKLYKLSCWRTPHQKNPISFSYSCVLLFSLSYCFCFSFLSFPTLLLRLPIQWATSPYTAHSQVNIYTHIQSTEYRIQFERARGKDWILRVHVPD